MFFKGIKGKQHFLQILPNLQEESPMIRVGEAYKDSTGENGIRGTDIYREGAPKKFDEKDS